VIDRRSRLATHRANVEDLRLYSRRFSVLFNAANARMRARTPHFDEEGSRNAVSLSLNADLTSESASTLQTFACYTFTSERTYVCLACMYISSVTEAEEVINMRREFGKVGVLAKFFP